MELKTVTLEWARNGSYGPVGGWHEFEAVAGSDVFRAFRHRTDYGWSWWSVTRNGDAAGYLTAGCATELPRSFQEWQAA